jgi:hypothetical protein
LHRRERASDAFGLLELGKDLRTQPLSGRKTRLASH